MARTLPPVKLDRSPLVLVLVQARFSPRTDLAVQLPEFRAACEALGYPVYRMGKVQTVNLGGSVPEAMEAPRWDFLDKTMRWNVVLSPEFLMLQTTGYEVFETFLERWRRLLAAATCLGIPVIERLGLRYVDLVQPKAGERVSDYLVPSLAGYEPPEGAGLQRERHVAATVLRTSRGQMLARVSPAVSSFPPDLDHLHLQGLVQPVPGSVFLDFDHATSEIMDFEADSIVAATEGLHDAHDILFRDAVTPHAMSVWGRKDLA